MTPPTIDIRIIQFLFSRLCHDLAGPIGAVGNGLELIAGFPCGDDPELLDLIAQGHRSAALKLEFARLAFGFGGGSSGTYLGDAERLCKALLGDDRIEVVWRADTGATDLPNDVTKLLMNMALAGEEALRTAKQGTLSVAVEAALDGFHIEVSAAGPGMALNPAYLDALAGRSSASDFDAAIAHGLFTVGLVQLSGGTLTLDVSTTDRVTLTTSVPCRDLDRPCFARPAGVRDRGRSDLPVAATGAE